MGDGVGEALHLRVLSLLFGNEPFPFGLDPLTLGDFVAEDEIRALQHGGPLLLGCQQPGMLNRNGHLLGVG
jgi:hypothetical protein